MAIVATAVRTASEQRKEKVSTQDSEVIKIMVVRCARERNVVWVMGALRFIAAKPTALDRGSHYMSVVGRCAPAPCTIIDSFHVRA